MIVYGEIKDTSKKKKERNDKCPRPVRGKRERSRRTRGREEKGSGKSGDVLPRAKKKAELTRTGTLKGPDAACESLRGRVDVPDGARAPP